MSAIPNRSTNTRTVSRQNWWGSSSALTTCEGGKFPGIGDYNGLVASDFSVHGPRPSLGTIEVVGTNLGLVQIRSSCYSGGRTPRIVGRYNPRCRAHVGVSATCSSLRPSLIPPRRSAGSRPLPNLDACASFLASPLEPKSGKHPTSEHKIECAIFHVQLGICDALIYM
jgi:hypothetical protein